MTLAQDCRPGEEKLYEFLGKVEKRLKNDWDIVLGVCGEEGSGKSMLSATMGWYLDPAFTPKRNIIANPNVKAVTDQLLGGLPRYSPVILDEAIKLMYKLGWQAKAQILLNTVFSVCRAQNKLVILCMPKFMDFNSYQRQHRIKIWIEVTSRGHAVVFVKDRSPFVSDCWYLKENQDQYLKFTKARSLVDISNEEYLEALRHVKSYAFEFDFQEPPLHVKREYLKQKEDMTLNFDVKEAEGGIAKQYREALKNAVGFMYTELALPRETISETLGMSSFFITSCLRELGVKPGDRAKIKIEAKPLNTPVE